MFDQRDNSLLTNLIPVMPGPCPPASPRQPSALSPATPNYSCFLCGNIISAASATASPTLWRQAAGRGGREREE